MEQEQLYAAVIVKDMVNGGKGVSDGPKKG